MSVCKSIETRKQIIEYLIINFLKTIIKNRKPLAN